MFQQVYNILKSFLGESKQGGYSSDIFQYQFNCPCCREENGGIPDGKYNLEVNLGIGKCQCWRCGETDGTKGSLSYLIRRYGSAELYRLYKEEIATLRKAQLYNLHAFKDVRLEIIEKKDLYLPKTFQKINLATCPDKRLLRYLEERKIDQRIINRFNLGYTTWENEDWKWRNRIIIPSYDEFGDLNFFVGRDFTKSDKRPKYLNCDENKTNIIFQESLIDYDADICLVEGALDCVFGPNCMALLGKKLTEDSEIYKKLYAKANGRIILCLDKDTKLIETKNIYKTLNFGRLHGKIWYIDMAESDYKDFGEIFEHEGRGGIIKTLKKAKQFKEIELTYK